MNGMSEAGHIPRSWLWCLGKQKIQVVMLWYNVFFPCVFVCVHARLCVRVCTCVWYMFVWRTCTYVHGCICTYVCRRVEATGRPQLSFIPLCLLIDPGSLIDSARLLVQLAPGIHLSLLQCWDCSPPHPVLFHMGLGH